MLYYIDEERPSYAVPVGVSLIIHLALLVSFVVVPAHLPREEKVPEFTVIEAFPETPGKIPARQSDSLRIADIDKPAVQKRPDKAKFAGMYDSSVKQETVASGRGGRRGSDAGASPAPEKRSRGKTVSKRDILDVDPTLFAEDEQPSETVENITAARQTKVGRVAIGGGAPGDYFPDIRRGEHTYLNVLRYPQIGYFVRLKRAFRTTFDPVSPLRQYFSVNHVARGSVSVILAVGVGETGQLSELFVLRSSGIPGYDQEALRTVRASSPFAKPPDKFLASDGNLRMMWTFTVYL